MGTGVLVLDEPTAQLDPAGTRAGRRAARGLAGGAASSSPSTTRPSCGGPTSASCSRRAGWSARPPGAALGTGAGRVGCAAALVRLAEAAAPPGGLRRGGDRGALRRAAARGAASAPSPRQPRLDAGPRPASRSRSRALVHRYPGRRGRPRVSLPSARRDGRDPRPERLRQDDARQAPQRAAPAGRRRVRSTAGRSAARVDELLAGTVGFVFQNPDDQLFDGRRARGRVRAAESRLRAATETLVERPSPRRTGRRRATNPYDLDLRPAQARRAGRGPGDRSGVLVLDEPTTGQDAPGVARSARSSTRSGDRADR